MNVVFLALSGFFPRCDAVGTGKLQEGVSRLQTLQSSDPEDELQPSSAHGVSGSINQEHVGSPGEVTEQDLYPLRTR